MEFEEGKGTTEERWEDEKESSLEQEPRRPAAALDTEESDDDEENEVQPQPVSLKQAENLLLLMQIVKEEGGGDPEVEREVEELARRLTHLCKSKEEAILSPDDAYLLRGYVCQYVSRLDGKRRRLVAEGASSEEQVRIYNDIGRAFRMMGPLVRIR